MAKAGLRHPDTVWRTHVGRAIDRARTLSGASLKQFAAGCARDERQVARWISGAERPHLDAIFAQALFRPALVIALAELAGTEVTVTTQITVKRSA